VVVDAEHVADSPELAVRQELEGRDPAQELGRRASRHEL